MAWWQVILIIIASIVVGFVMGGLISYIIVRFFKRSRPSVAGDMLSLAEVRDEISTAGVSPIAVAEDALYQGKVELNVAAPADFIQILGLQSLLRQVPGLKFVSVGGCATGDSTMVVVADKPLPLANIVRQIPSVKDVVGMDRAIRVELE